MQGDRLRQAETIFELLVNAPPEERDALLAQHCGEDPELRAFVERLLRHHESGGGGALEPPVATTDNHPDAVPDPATAAADTVAALGASGRSLGPYVLRERLGAGGMGEVWRAEQSAPIRRTVALKLIKAGMDSAQVITRFEAERQALALMDHPGIARVLDAGTTPEGRPYFVMEHVPGLPITQYCDNRRLDTRRRLELFERVCEAVQHAHQKAVIHRDLKPSNILVTDVDGQPLPKIIDFGVAKATAHRLTERTMHTMLGQMIGTPEYMSPEQADFTAEDVDTRTDVYSLGVVLYELLVGALPFETTELRNAGLEGILRMLREKDPPRPSTRLSTLRDRTPEIARHRRTEPGRLAGQLKGDLDWIVMRALEKDRNRRYGSALELAQDVRRHLDDEPVLAGPPSVLYRTGKFVRRHRIGVASGAIAIVALVGVTVTMGVLRGQAEQARAEAQARASQLEAMTEFQASMLSGIDPAAMGLTLRDDLRRRVRESLDGEGATSDEVEAALAAVDDILRRANPTDMAVDLLEAEVLDRAAAAVARDFADQPLVRAALRQTLADVYYGIGRHGRALPLQEAALETRRRELGDDHEDTLESLIGWGWLRFSTGDLDGARDSFQEALERSRRVLGEEHPQTLAAVHAMGRYCGRTGDEEGRLLYQRQAMEGSRRAFGNEDSRTLEAIEAVGMSLMSGGRMDEALPYYREVWERRRRVLGDENPSTLESKGHVGYALAGMGRVEEALPYLDDALEGLGRVLGDDHPSTIGVLDGLGFALWSVERMDEALTCYRGVLEGRQRVYGNDSASTLTAAANLGWVLMDKGDFEAARPYVVSSLEGRRRTLGNANYKTLVSFAALAWLQLNTGEVDQAVALLEPREAEMRRDLAVNPSYLGMYLTALGRSRTVTGRFEDAESVLLESESMAFWPTNRKRVLKELVRLSEVWDVAEPDAGHDQRAAEWRAKLDEVRAGSTSEHGSRSGGPGRPRRP